jgi:hypothetical protein
MPLPNEQEISLGRQIPNDTWGEFNNMSFLVQQALGKMQTATLVRVEACTNSGGLSPVGFVDVTPLINQIDGQGNAQPHATIFNVPYSRAQGGANAVIMDPVVGDIGICVFANRDLSKVKSTKKQANPGSYRSFSFSDGLYIGGVLNGTPTQYTQFNNSGITIHSPTAITLSAPDIQLIAPTIELNASASVSVTTPVFTVTGSTVLVGGLSQSGGNAIMSGTLTVTGDITGAGKSVSTHIHGGVQTGIGNTGTPV